MKSSSDLATVLGGEDERNGAPLGGPLPATLETRHDVGTRNGPFCRLPVGCLNITFDYDNANEYTCSEPLHALSTMVHPNRIRFPMSLLGREITQSVAAVSVSQV